MKILGINAFHGDSSAALIIDGKLIAAAEEERFRRIKHWAGFPTEAISYCLVKENLSLSDIDIVAINQDSKANLLKKILFTIFNKPDLHWIIEKIRNKQKRKNIVGLLEQFFAGQNYTGKICYVQHHMAHLASTFYVSPFEEAIALSIDGFGDFSSSAWGLGSGTRLTIDGQIYFPHSLGIFYEAITHYLGFPHYGDEYKVMGLAPYGEPVYLDAMHEIVKLKNNGNYSLNLDYFIHDKKKVEYKWNNEMPVAGDLFSEKLEVLLGPARRENEELTQKHKDIARSTQMMYEEAFFHLLNALHNRYGIDKLALSGGCAMNSVANGKIYRNTPFKKVYIQAAAGDAGGAIGAAFYAWYELNSNAERKFVMDHAYWGPDFSDSEIIKLLESRHEVLEKQSCNINKFDNESELCKTTADAIAKSKVVGWFQGRMEWGPRALGNRSIICDPRNAKMKEILNHKIKRRESFRPFAPSILREVVSEWFEEDDDVPFMMKVFQIKPEKRMLVPAVTHVDGSGRLQTVIKDTNPRYYGLIHAFYEKTGIPLVLNTSFNENEPVVCKPEEALDCFLRTQMDILILENYMIIRN